MGQGRETLYLFQPCDALSPIEEYMLELPDWDGIDHIRRLADTLPATIRNGETSSTAGS